MRTKSDLEDEIAKFMRKAFGDSFKSVSISDDDFETLRANPDILSLPANGDHLEYGTVALRIELQNGSRFELSASEWAQITLI